MLSFAKLGEYPGSGTLTLESAKSAVECFVFLNSDFSHCLIPPSAAVYKPLPTHAQETRYYPDDDIIIPSTTSTELIIQHPADNVK
jgi:hypothetical protein